MNPASHPLLKNWRGCQVDTPPYIFPGDECVIPKDLICQHNSFDAFVTSDGFGRIPDRRLHVGLLPIPFIGNLQSASIFVLMLNPGLSPGDYFAEYDVPEFRNALVRNLRQDNVSGEFPFVSLDPHFAWHPGFGYWQGKLHDIAKMLVCRGRVPSYREALKSLAQRVACLELVPYHSKSFGAKGLLSKLRSTELMLSYVREVLIPRVLHDEAIAIVTRGVENWNLPEHKNIVKYEGAQTRSAHLTRKSPGWEIIAKQLGLSSR